MDQERRNFLSRSLNRTLRAFGFLPVAIFALAQVPVAGAEPVSFYLDSGEEVEAVPLSVEGNLISVQAPAKNRNLPLPRIVAVKSAGNLVNGPFDQARIREILGMPAPSVPAAAIDSPPSNPAPGPDADSPPASASARAPDSAVAEYGPTYYRYGEYSTGAYMAPMPGQPGHAPGMSKVFTSCVTWRGSERCGPPLWIGFFGEDLAAALGEVPEARSVANHIKTTTLIKGACLIAIPFLFFPGISAQNGPEDQYGKVHTHIGPTSVILYSLTAVAFANYVGWNIYEGYVARKAIRIYNEKKSGVKVSAGAFPGGGLLSARLDW